MKKFLKCLFLLFTFVPCIAFSETRIEYKPIARGEDPIIIEGKNLKIMIGAPPNELSLMAYQMGVEGTFKFKMMWQAIGVLDWEEASNQMRDSKWFRDPKTRGRAGRMAKRMHFGVWNV